MRAARATRTGATGARRVRARFGPRAEVRRPRRARGQRRASGQRSEIHSNTSGWRGSFELYVLRVVLQLPCHLGKIEEFSKILSPLSFIKLSTNEISCKCGKTQQFNKGAFLLSGFEVVRGRGGQEGGEDAAEEADQGGGRQVSRLNESLLF